MKKILGLDIGTNSIGWAVVSASIDDEGSETLHKIESAGSRIIPMDAASLGKFDSGNLQTQTAQRTQFRSARRLFERRILRRERLHRILNLMGFLPPHYAEELDRYGKFKGDAEPKIAWVKGEDGKLQFMFKEAFQEMLHDFEQKHPTIGAEGQKIPYDWTLYYLRKKALTQAVSKEELAWILLSFNQKRGYYQSRNEEEEVASDQIKEYRALEVLDVVDSGEHKGKATWYHAKLENGMVYKYASTTPLTSWKGQVRDFIITTYLDKEGKPKTDKDGSPKYSVSMPKPDDWLLHKKKTEDEIDKAHKHVGAYIYDTLLADPKMKIRGNWVNTIDRVYYKEELKAILHAQMEFHSELRDAELYRQCCEELYPMNEAHRKERLHEGFVELLRDDILFYQRPLKSKKSLIAECPYEERYYTDKETGEVKRIGVKCIPKSHPLFQEFRLWQFISNLRIYQREKWIEGKLCIDVNVTDDFLATEEQRAKLFDNLSRLKSIDQKALLKLLGLKDKVKPHEKELNVNLYRWNYVEDKAYPCNETYAQIGSYLKKAKIDPDVLTDSQKDDLWQILYSVSDRKELEAALRHFAEKHNLDEDFVLEFIKFPTFENSYGSYSEKAIKKLLPLMRMGSHWSEEVIDSKTKERIEKILTKEYDEGIQKRVCDKAIHLQSISDFRGLPLWLAAYIVYNRHSEAKEITKWETPEDIDRYLNDFRQYSLRNPVVEQIILETLRTVRDIWKQEGHIDEIHVELGREMKSSKEARIRMLRQNSENENTNLRIKALLQEFMNEEYAIEDVRPYSPSQQETLRIYEDTVLRKVEKVPEDIGSILKKFNEKDQAKQPTHSEIIRYKLWLDQKYLSPYTGTPIPLAKLFTSAYEVDHIIPRKRYYDDSLSNKVVCEAEVNKDKSALLGYEYIQKNHGKIIQLSNGSSAKILSVEEYVQRVKDNYSHNKRKMKNLLMDDVPEEFSSRQLNDSRYISKFVKSVLSNIVREENEQEDTSKNIISCTGAITDRLKKDWGMNDVWNKIVLPRFEQLNLLRETTEYTSVNTSGCTIPAMPLNEQKGFNKKRIDHRHHAMDALVIACASRNIVNYLNNSNAASDRRQIRYDLQAKLCTHKQFINKPWNTFTEDAFATLSRIVVTFKQNQRIINKAVNRYEHFDADGKKVLMTQAQREHWAIRKPLHIATYYGAVNLRMTKEVSLKAAMKVPQSIVNKEFRRQLGALIALGFDEKKITKFFETNHDVWQDVNLKKIPIYYFTQDTKDRYYASRESLNEDFNEKKIEKITDSGIKKILKQHLAENNDDPKIAFSPEGIERMNQDIVRLNNNRFHQPIKKVRTCEKAEGKFAVGNKGVKQAQFVEAEKGTNLFFAIYKTEKTDPKTQEISVQRTYATIPLNEVIQRLKNKLSPVPQNEEGKDALFVLSPNDLVYLPTPAEIRQGAVNQPLDRNRIYKMVSATRNQCFFIPERIAKVIVDKIEFGSMNKVERAQSGEMIKEYCVPIKFDRLGNLIEEVKII